MISKLLTKITLGALIYIIASAPAFAKDPETYKNELMQFNVVLSANDKEQVREWLLDWNSGFPDLADKLMEVLSNTRPKGNTTVLDAVMGKYRIVNGKPASQYIAPPYDKEKIKKAYVKNWKERNSSRWQALPEPAKADLNLAFDYITNPNMTW